MDLLTSVTRSALLAASVFAQVFLAGAALAQAPGASAPQNTPEASVTSQSEREYIRPQQFRLTPPGPCSSELQASVRLSGTVYDARHPERSLAVLATPSTHKTGVYRCGARWGALRILEVRPRAVLVGSDTDSPCWLPMTRPNAPAAAPATAPKQRERSSRRRAAFTSDELEQSIQMIRPDVYRVDRALLDKAFARAAQISRTTRTRTVEVRGAPVGMSITSLPQGGLFEHLGLKRGDVLKTLNGFQVASLDGMLKAKTQLGSASRLSLSVVRGGKPMTLEYRLH